MTNPDIAEQCSISRAAQILGDGWMILLLRELFWGSTRYDEFAAHTGMASNVLAVRLKRLVDAGVITKNPVAGDGRRFDYALTPSGLELFPVLMSVMAWGDKHVPGESGPLVLLRHKSCGQRTKAGLVCSACGEPLRPTDIETQFNRRYEKRYGPLEKRSMSHAQAST
jgi:DNA-binding HxlR family transcriptional regulator